MKETRKRWGLEWGRVLIWSRNAAQYLGSGWWGDVEGFHCEENGELENALRRHINRLRSDIDLTQILYFLLFPTYWLLHFVVARMKTAHCVMSTSSVDTREMQNILPLTRAALENIIRFQLKGHDHAVKSAQLSGRDQHSERNCSHIQFVFRYQRSIEIYVQTLFFLTHLISLRRSSFSGLSKIANRGRTKSSITLSDKNWGKNRLVLILEGQKQQIRGVVNKKTSSSSSCLLFFRWRVIVSQ